MRHLERVRPAGDGTNGAGELGSGETSSSPESLQSARPSPWITGEVFVDLTDVAEDKARLRVHSALTHAPAGAVVVVYVGPLAVNPAVLPVVWEYGQHVQVKVTGHGHAVPRWVDALRNGLGVGQ